MQVLVFPFQEMQMRLSPKIVRILGVFHGVFAITKRRILFIFTGKLVPFIILLRLLEQNIRSDMGKLLVLDNIFFSSVDIVVKVLVR